MNRNLYANFSKIQRLLCKAIYVFMRRVLLSLFRFKGGNNTDNNNRETERKKNKR